MRRLAGVIDQFMGFRDFALARPRIEHGPPALRDKERMRSVIRTRATCSPIPTTGPGCAWNFMFALCPAEFQPEDLCTHSAERACAAIEDLDTLALLEHG
jgi:hypothetical protein